MSVESELVFGIYSDLVLVVFSALVWGAFSELVLEQSFLSKFVGTLFEFKTLLPGEVFCDSAIKAAKLSNFWIIILGWLLGVFLGALWGASWHPPKTQRKFELKTLVATRARDKPSEPSKLGSALVRSGGEKVRFLEAV